MLSIAIIFALGSAGILKSEILTNFLIQIVVVSGIPIILYSLFVSKSLKKTFSDFGFKKLSWKLFWYSCLIALILYIINLFVATFFSSVTYIFGYEPSLPTLSVSYSTLLKDFFYTACLPGLCEEVIHRGLLLNGSKKCGYTRYGLIISSLLFGLLHLNIEQFFYASILGCLMGISVLATESIWTSVICHFTNNFFSVFFSHDLNTFLHKICEKVLSIVEKLSIFEFVIISTIAVLALLWLFNKIIAKIKAIKLQEKTEKLSKELNFENLSEEEAKNKVEQINTMLEALDKERDILKEKNKPGYIERIFIISAICLGTIGTIFTFLYGFI